MTAVNERLSIKASETINILFPPIQSNQTQLLLIYEASEELHAIDIKERIVSFLIIKGAVDITAYVNTSIYFKMTNFKRPELVELEKEFKNYVAALEVKHNGKIFWLFNEIANYAPSEEEIKLGKKRTAMIGTCNRTLKDNFEGIVKAHRDVYNEKK